jgi:uncharacterized protein
MSLRDQFLKAGLVSQKKVKSANRELKESRRHEQATRDSKKQIAKREAIAREAESAASLARREREAADRKVAQQAMDGRRLVQRLLRDHVLPHRDGQQDFWFVAGDRRTILRLEIPASWAHDLRAGRLAIVWLGDDPHPERAEHRVLQAVAVERLQKHAPERVLFFNEAPPPEDDPAEKLSGWA